MIDRCFDALTRGIFWLVGGALIAAVLLNVANVILRYVFQQPVLGLDELQIFLMVWMTFLGFVVVTWRNMHLRMDILLNRMPAWLRRWVYALEMLLLVVLCVFVLSQTVDYVMQMFALGRRSDGAGIPVWIPNIAVVLGFALAALIGLLRLAQAVAGAAMPEPAEPQPVERPE